MEVNGKPEALGLCPFHGDHNPSLSVNIETGLFRCFSCDARGDIFTFYQKYKDCDFPTALHEIGEMAGVVGSDTKPKVVATFRYTDEAGNVLYLKERLEPGRNGRSKEFVFKHLGGDKWILGRGCDPMLYNLPQVTKSKYVFVVEGEAKADLLNSWGLVATCLDSGANSPIKNEHIEILSKLEKVVILPDSDKPGREYASKIASALYDEAKELKVVVLPGLQEAGDIIDWIKTPGNDKPKLLELVENTPLWTPPKEITFETVRTAFNTTDLGNAKRLVARYGDKIRYCFPWKKWLCWDGKAWRIDDDGHILRLAKDTIKNIYQEASQISDSDHRGKVAKWAIKSEEEKKLKSMVSLAQSEPGIPIYPQVLDANPYLLNCSNGTIDLKVGELKPHTRKDFITKTIPIEYKPDTDCPRWIEFLETIFHWNYDLISYVQSAVGYSLTGDISEQCFFLLHGVGANGKSTFLNCIAELLGEFSQTTDFETFLIKKNDGGIRNDIARMKGQRLITAIESEGERRLAESMVKQLTGGDTISARFLFAEFFDFKPTFKIWLAANHKPNIRGTDYAIWRRIRLIPFDVTIPEDKRDSKLAEKLRAELPGILAWAVQGCLEWQKNGLQTPNEVKSATNKYQGEMDVVGLFLNECCLVKPESPEVKTVSSELYEVYKDWCGQNGEFALDNRKFGRRLSEKGLRSGKTSGKNWWYGIGVHDQQ